MTQQLIQGFLTAALYNPSPAHMTIFAAGYTSSTHWTDGTLVNKGVNADGWMVLDFVATPPTGGSLPIRWPITASVSFPFPGNANFKGWQVVCADGSHAFPYGPSAPATIGETAFAT